MGRLRSRSIHHKALVEHCELNTLGACTYRMSTEPSYRIHEGRGDISFSLSHLCDLELAGQVGEDQLQQSSWHS